MTKFKIVYTISDNEKMKADLMNSIESALNFVNGSDIIVISTPNHDYDLIDKLKEDVNVFIYNKNYTKPWRLHPYNKSEESKRYGEKLLITTIGYKNVIFLDCDTYIYNHPEILFDEDYDFGGSAIDYPEKEVTPWQMRRNVLDKIKFIYNLKGDNIHIWNGGHLIFRNFLHIKLHDIWLKYFDDWDKLDKVESGRHTFDQLSLTPALAELEDIKIKCFDVDKIMKTGWYRNSWKNYKFPKSVCILHGDNLKEHIEKGRELGYL